MKDKEKQLANDLVEIFDKEYQKRGLLTPTFTAKQLCELDYQKVGKNSVVLSREEYEELKHYEDEMYRLQGVVDQLTNEGWDILDEKEEKIRQLERKETAEKIYKDIRLFLDDKTLEVITRYFKEIFGVEIKE